MNKPELIAPAGNLEKLKFAVAYGADAVYAGGERYGLRAYAGNFSPEELTEGIRFAHRARRKVYITVNALMNEEDIAELPEYLAFLEESGIDGIIVGDLGALAVARRCVPSLPVTLSTQMSVMNTEAARVYKELGASRIVAARELSLKEMLEIRRMSGVEIEAFVHGAMCISYSGRCLMSSYMVGRSANRGECAQPCRYNYALVEEKRPGEYFPIEEDDRGTYILNSKDLCLWDEVPLLIEAGIDAFKIEGRMKSLHYVATVTRAYREAIDCYLAGRPCDSEFWHHELDKVATRPYTKGFLFGIPADAGRDFVKKPLDLPALYCGIVTGYDETRGLAQIEERSPFSIGDELEFFTPQATVRRIEVRRLYDAELNPAQRAYRARELVWLPVEERLPEYTLVRRKSADGSG